MQRIQKTEGIIIKCKDFTDTSQLVTFFTKDFGKLKVVAKGSRAKSKKFKGKMDLFIESEIIFYRKTRTELHTLSECSIIDTHSQIRSDFDHVATASYVSELLEVSVGVEDPIKGLYELVKDVFGWLQEEKDLQWVRNVFEIKLLQLLGHLPQMQLCGKCNGSLGEIVFFEPENGWFCDRCGSGKRKISRGVFAIIEKIAYSPRFQMIKISKTQKEELNNLMRLFIDFSVGKRLKSLDFL